MASLRCASSASAAKAFVRLATLRTSVAATPTSPCILDILIPPGTARSFGSKTTSNVAKHAAPIRSATTLQGRAFSTSPSRRLTQAVFNPRKDDEGNEMLLDITPRAAKRLSEIMIKDSNPQLALRIQVESGGCHGFQYLMSLVTLSEAPPTNDAESGVQDDSANAVREDDTIFTYVDENAPAGGSATGGFDGPKVILDTPSLELLKGSKVDFTMELIGSQFKIVDNPLATSSCGCGTSFDIKV